MKQETIQLPTLTGDHHFTILDEQDLNHEGYKVNPEDVKLEVGNRWEGYGMAEHQVPYFKECSVVLKGETK